MVRRPLSFAHHSCLSDARVYCMLQPASARSTAIDIGFHAALGDAKKIVCITSDTASKQMSSVFLVAEPSKIIFLI